MQLATLVLLIGVVNTHNIDWLVTPPSTSASVDESRAGMLVLQNGLMSRIFILDHPAFGTVDLRLNATASRGGERSSLRAIKPEGVLKLDNATYAIGGLVQTSTFLAYLNRSSLELGTASQGFDGVFEYQSHEVCFNHCYLLTLTITLTWR